jgi:hypothetical protein
MSKKSTVKVAPTLAPPTPLSRRLIRSAIGFSVGVAVGLAPFLGRVSVPGFSALLSLFPEELQTPLLPLSAFLMGIIAAGTQFYSGTKLSIRALEQNGQKTLKVLLTTFVLLLAVYFFLVERAHYGNLVVPTVTGVIRLKSCPCKSSISDAECLMELSANPNKVESCWGRTQVRLSELALSVIYLTLTGSFVGFVGLLLLQEQKKSSVQKK